MKEVKLLDREQAALYLYINHILATIQESGLKRELVCLININNTQQLTTQLVIRI